MTALDDARSAADAWARHNPAATGARDIAQRMESALRALIAEHERVTSIIEAHRGYLELPRHVWVQLKNPAGGGNAGLPATAPSPAVPTDEREALANLIADGQGHPDHPRPTNLPPFQSDYRSADLILAAGFRRQGPITYAQVEVVWQTLELDDIGHLSRSNLRTALEAARAAS